MCSSLMLIRIYCIIIMCARSSRHPAVQQLLQSSRVHSAKMHFGRTSNRVLARIMMLRRWRCNTYHIGFIIIIVIPIIIIVLMVKSYIIMIIMRGVYTVCRQKCDRFAPAAVTQRGVRYLRVLLHLHSAPSYGYNFISDTPSQTMH